MEPNRLPTEPRPLLSLALAILLEAKRCKASSLAAKAGMSRTVMSELINGHRLLTRQRFDELAGLLEAGPLEVERALVAAGLVDFEETPAPSPTPVLLTAQERWILEKRTALYLRNTGERVLSSLVSQVCGEKFRFALDEAAALWQQLASCSKPARYSRVQEEARFQQWPFCLWLCDESERKAADHAGVARHLAELAVLVAGLLRRKEPANRFFTRLAGLAEASLGNALRVKGDLEPAEAAFARAWPLWNAGADEAGLLSEARLHHLEASLRRDQGHFDVALQLLARASERARPGEQSTILLKQSATLAQIGDHEGALAALSQTAPLIDETRQPRQFFGLLFNQATCLCRLGRAEEAEPLVEEVQRLAHELGNGLDRMRTLALQSLVDAGLGRIEAAIASQELVCRAFRARGHAFDFALEALDLALLYRRRGRWPDIRELATQMVGIFRARKIPRETLAAVLLFQEAARQEAVTEELVRRLRAYLKEARARPGLRFALS